MANHASTRPHTPQSPPILHTSFHSLSPNRLDRQAKAFDQAHLRQLGFGFHLRQRDRLGMSFTALTSTSPKMPFSSVGSGRYSPITSTIPTTAFSSPE